MRRTSTTCSKPKRSRLPRITIAVQQQANLPRALAGGGGNYAMPRGHHDPIVIEATTVPNDAGSWATIVWTANGVISPAAAGSNGRRFEIAGNATSDTVVRATFSGEHDEVRIFVFWITMAAIDHGAIPVDCTKDFSQLGGGGIRTNPGTLGTIVGINNVTGLGQGHGRICIQGTMAPAGINAFVRTGLRMARTIVHEKTWTDGVLQEILNANDTNTDNSVKQWTPTAQDHIYDLDAPSIALFNNQTIASVETYMHFQQTVTHFGEVCSDTVDWHFIGEYLTGTPPALDAHPAHPPETVQITRGQVPNVNRVAVAGGALNVAGIAAPRFAHRIAVADNVHYQHVIDLDNSGERP